MRYLVVNKDTNIIENAIEWDGATPYLISSDKFLSPDDGAYDIGDIYVQVE